MVKRILAKDQSGVRFSLSAPNNEQMPRKGLCSFNEVRIEHGAGPPCVENRRPEARRRRGGVAEIFSRKLSVTDSLISDEEESTCGRFSLKSLVCDVVPHPLGTTVDNVGGSGDKRQP